MLGRRMAGLEAPLPLTGLARAERKNIFYGEHTPNRTLGYLAGLRHPQSWNMAPLQGAMVSRFDAGLSINTTAVGQSIFNMTGTANMLVDASAPFLNAVFPAFGTAGMTITTSGTLRGIGQMNGTTIESGAVTNASIAAAVLAAAAGSPIYANIRQVNNVTVNGTGAPGSEWGP